MWMTGVLFTGGRSILYSMKWLAVLLLLLCGGSAHAYSSGAPSQACSTLTPGHGGLSQSSPSPYNLDLSIFNLYSDGNYYYIPGQTYQCKQCQEHTLWLFLRRVQLDAYFAIPQWLSLVQPLKDFWSRQGKWRMTQPSLAPSLTQPLDPSSAAALPLPWALNY